MDERIARLKTSKEAGILVENARRLGKLELAAQAQQRANELRAIEEGYRSPAEQAIAAALYAYEEQQSRLKGRTFRATRTRQMLSKHGALAAAERMVLQRKPSRGFEVLEDAGLQELSFEAIIDRFSDEFSTQAVQAARARLEGKPASFISSPSTSSHDQALNMTIANLPVVLDAEAEAFIEGFMDPGVWFQARWLPRYTAIIRDISDAMAADRPQDVFEILWKSAENSISNAGQGILKYDTVERMRQELVEVIRDIYADGSPENFNQIVARFNDWKRKGHVGMVPRLLIARAFAGIHPRLYHTTVDSHSQNLVIDWFAAHTNFRAPRSDSWSVQARALVIHIDRAGVFGDNFLVRNIFPWFVIEQIRARSSSKSLKPGHSPRPEVAFANLPSRQRIISLRHNVIQTALFSKLSVEFGKDRVWTEYPTGTGGYADAIVRHPDGYCQLYEIKIADTSAKVVRQAIGQLLEYGFRPGGLEAKKLFIVGEPVLDDVTRSFLVRLREDFNIEIDYMQVELFDESGVPVLQKPVEQEF
ncbi:MULTISPECIES: hypothetical protein [unclassified Pseudoxanthomonas]|uniref:hypothetical protein n=1 Tax=unclassified Pseudoxanthomonas TaxID=2645906 RepID=UPI00161712B6|nr:MULTISPECIES: hypothetical protein [unclassified Pseudoxanthomonas]MBB3275947.1 hypothetical protein [Pseudoxanthomonas sp. OG2]MBV7472972.1 hypothetical protein [Pseudoxanthomonas sp. PXM05]